MCYEKRDPEQARVCFERDQRKGAYIAREAVRDMLHREMDAWGNCADEISALLKANDALFSLPAEDVAPILHGRWGVEVGMNWFKERICHVCKKHIESNFWNYCPSCGARMDGE